MTALAQQTPKAEGRIWRFRAAVSHLALGLLAVTVFLFLYAPLAVTALYSFNDNTAMIWPIEEFSTKWYHELFTDPELWSSVRNSIIVALAAVAISLLFGAGTAIVLDRVRFVGSGAISALLLLPFVIPGVLTGLALALFFYWVGVPFSLTTVALGHVTFVTPVMYFLVASRLARSDRTLEKASMDLGANYLRTFWHVTLPTIRMSLVAAALLGITLSLDEVIITYFVIGSERTLPMEIWTRIRFGFTPEINAVFTIVVGVTFISTLLAALLWFRTGRSRSAVTAAVAE
jgi:spermidine/putrescine transport system permease protein